jgi:hypothetical protein
LEDQKAKILMEIGTDWIEAVRDVQYPARLEEGRIVHMSTDETWLLAPDSFCAERVVADVARAIAGGSR